VIVIASDAMQDFHTIPSKSGVYLDHNATTPLSSEVAGKVPALLTAWGNPSSIHQFGRGPKAVMRAARKKLSLGLGCRDLELVFTSGGSESNTSVIRSVFDRQKLLPAGEKRMRMICSAVEHPAVIQAMSDLVPHGLDWVQVPVDRGGAMDLEFLEKALRDKPTSLVSIMFANNETGSLLPVEQACQLAHKHGALFHSDMVQALGKVSFSLQDLGFDFASFSAHKFYALKGCGVLYARTGSKIDSLIKVGRQERGRRAGTENALAIASLGIMAERLPEVEERAMQMRQLRDFMAQQMLERIPEVSFNGCAVQRLPNCCSAIIPGVDGETLLMNLDMKGFAVSTGAACSSGSPEPSPTLLAMGLSREEAQSSLRVGLGWSTTRAQVEQFLEVLEKTVVRLRSFQHGGSAYGELK
jgi:cysteine desulfurase